MRNIRRAYKRPLFRLWTPETSAARAQRRKVNLARYRAIIAPRKLSLS